MANRLLLLRHGSLGTTQVGRFIGSTDLSLTPEGREQVRRMASVVRSFEPDRYFSSPKTRCRETVATLELPLEVTFDSSLRELEFGDWEGRTFAEVAAADPAMVGRFATLAPEFVFPGGECLADFFSRVHGMADRLAADPASTVLVVAHGGVIRAILCHLLGLEPRQHLAFDIQYASLAVLDLFEDRDGTPPIRGVFNALIHPELALPTERS